MSELMINGSGPGGLTADDHNRIRIRNMGIADALRNGRRSQAEIAAEFGVSKATVSNVSRFNVQGKKRWQGKKKPAPQPAVMTPGMIAMRQAEMDLRHAKRNVLLAEAQVHQAQAMLYREQAEALD